MNKPALTLYRPLLGAKARIVAFPHAGGGASVFSKLRLELAAQDIELCPLQPPGRENRSSQVAHSTVEALADEFSQALTKLPSLPTAFLGHSFGGLVGYLVAKQLASSANAPLHFVASGSVSPAMRLGGEEVASDEVYRKRIGALGGIPQVIAANPELLAMFEHGIIADMKLADRYQHQSCQPLTCRISVYSGFADKAASPHIAQAWQSLTSHALSTRNFTGDHFFLYANPHLTASALVSDIGWIVQHNTK